MATATASVAAQQMDAEAATAALEWRQIGPTIMGGRVADLAVNEKDPAVFYVGTATGGLWKTENGGTTFSSLFDDQPTASVGDVTLAPSNPNVVWVGSGEPQNRQSSPWGMGVFRSTDAGRTWTHLGLDNTHHISRIQVHPRDPDMAYVAAVGHLWGANPERGVFRTTDGGETWENVLFVDEHTGAIDLVMDPSDPKTLFAAMYQRQRAPWGFNGGGPGSGIYRTTDGGETWTELMEGLPQGDMGRIGLGIHRGDGNLIYALVEADARAPGQGFFGQQNDDRQTGLYKSTDRGESWTQVSTTNNRPMYYSQVWVDPSDPERIYLGGANMYRSSDGGNNFTSDAAAGVHSDHHALWINPQNSDHLILGGDGGVSISWDRSDSWRQLRNLPLAQFYEIGVDDRHPYHVCGGLQDNGSWCAPSDTWSNQGIRAKDWYNVGGGDGFFTVMHPDGESMLAESQNGNLMMVNLRTFERLRMRPLGRPGEGGGEEGEDEDEDELPSYRWNWNAPIVISRHDHQTIYYAGNHVFRSTDYGMSWEEISPDLTKAIDRTELEIMGVAGSEPMMSANDGTSTFGNIVSLAESPLNPQVLYAGTDDGNLNVTRDGGETWTNVAPNVRGMPDQTYMTRVVASHGDEGTVWVAGDNHRNDDFAAYVFRSTDFGQSWEDISDGLPELWSVNALAQHPRAADLLFLGNEVGVYFSIDAGDSWHSLRRNMPTVPVDDIQIQARENDLVLGTHGRGVWIMDDITPLEEMTADVLASDVHLFSTQIATSYTPYTPQGWTPGVFEADNPPQGVRIRYWLGADVAADEGDEAEGDDGESGVTVTIADGSGEVIRTLQGAGERGLHEVIWNFRHDSPTRVPGGGGGFGGGFFGGGGQAPKVVPGQYVARLEAGGTVMETPLEVELDPRVSISRDDLLARQGALMSGYELSGAVAEAMAGFGRVRDALEVVQEQMDGRDAPESLSEMVTEIDEELDEVGDDLGQARQGAGLAGLGSFHRAPTADQLWRLDRGWELLPGAVDRLNILITDRMPALLDALDDADLRPDLGDTVSVPTAPGGQD